MQKEISTNIFQLKFENLSKKDSNHKIGKDRENLKTTTGNVSNCPEQVGSSSNSTNSGLSVTNRATTQKSGRKPKDPHEQPKQKILLDMKSFVDQKGGLVDLKGIPVILEIIKRETLPETRIIPIQILNLTENLEIIKEFMFQQGVFPLTEWVSIYKDQIENQAGNLEQKDYDLLDQILNLSNKMPIKPKDLKNTKFGKQINKLGKCVSDPKIKGKCEAIVDRWKKMISDQKEKSLKATESKEENQKGKTENIDQDKDQGYFQSSQGFNFINNQNLQNNNPNNMNNMNNTFSNSSYHDNQFINKKREKRDFEQEFDKNNKKYNTNFKFPIISFLIKLSYCVFLFISINI